MEHIPIDPSAQTRTLHVAPVMYRQVEMAIEPTMRRAEGDAEDERVYAMTFASETPVKRTDWWTGEVWYEVLSHDPEDVDLSRAANGLPFLSAHDRHQVIGSVDNIHIGQDRRSHGEAVFSSIPNAQEKQTLVDEGHVKTVSFGYEITGVVLESTDENGVSTYRVSWLPMEITLEPIPADFSVGIGRSHTEDGGRPRNLNPVEFTIPVATIGGERSMDKDKKVETLTPTPEPRSAVEVVTDVGEIKERAAAIFDLCQLHGMTERAGEFARSELTVDGVAATILETKRSAPAPTPPAESLEGLPDEDRRKYSVHKAIRSQMLVMDGKRNALDGLEGEIHQELSKNRSGTDHGGVLIPWRVLREDDPMAIRMAMHRTLGTTEPTGGAAITGTQYMPDLIDMLRPKSRVIELGARVLVGLTGPVQFSRKDAAAMVHWMQENPASGAAESEPEYGYVGLKAKTLIGNVPIPRQLMVSSTIDVEADIRNDLSLGTGLAIDLGALHGLGSDNQPVGLWEAAGVLTAAQGGVPTKVTVTNMASALAAQNADLGSLAYLTTTELSALLTVTPKESGYPVYIWDGTFNDGTMMGYPAKATNQCASDLGSGSDEHAFIFGNWNDLLVGIFGNDLEIVVDVVTLADKGQIKLVSYAMADTAVRRSQSFCKGTGAKLA